MAMTPVRDPRLEPDPQPEELQQRYAAIEQVYAAQNWPEVEARSRSLLAELPDEASHPLRQRVLLLLAHTLLYGNGDPAAAASLYRAVLTAAAEAVLVEMAEQGLVQCGQPLAPSNTLATGELAGEELAGEELAASAVSAQPPPDAGSTAGVASDLTTPAEAEPAMPWLQELGGEQARRPGAIDDSLALAPFQVGSAQLSGPDSATPDAPPEPTSQPLRWPFMADFVDRPPAERQENADRTLARAFAPAEGPEGSVDMLVERGGLTAPATQPTTVLEPELEPEALERSRFSLEEIQSLSRGLLRVTLLARSPSAQDQA